MRGQSPSSPEAGREAARALEPNLVALAHHATPPSRLFGLGVPGQPPAPGGLPADALAPPRPQGRGKVVRSDVPLRSQLDGIYLTTLPSPQGERVRGWRIPSNDGRGKAYKEGHTEFKSSGKEMTLTQSHHSSLRC